MLIIIVSCNSKKRKTKSSQRNLNTTIVKPDAKKKYAETQSLNELQKCVSADRKNTENEVESVDQTQDLDRNSSYKERLFSSNTSFVANNLSEPILT